MRESTVRISTRCREERRDCVRIMRERERVRNITFSVVTTFIVEEIELKVVASEAPLIFPPLT